MASHNASNAECVVYTYKHGLLSKVAHDLKIQATSFQIDVDDDSKAISASIDAASLRVVCSMKKGQEDHGALSAKDKKDIDKNIVKDVLHPNKHPRITFNSSSVSEAGSGYRIAGQLELHGRKRSIAATATRQSDRYVIELTIHQPDFGIKPFSAMLGALKVKPDVKLRISLTA